MKDLVVCQVGEDREMVLRHVLAHPTRTGAREHFDGAKESDGGYLRPTKRRLVDVFVSKATLDRALRTANALFLALEHIGHQVAFAPLDQRLGRPAVDERSKGGRERYERGGWAPDRPTVVYVGTVAIGLTIFELSEEVEVQYVDGKYVPVAQVPVSRRRGLLSTAGAAEIADESLDPLKHSLAMIVRNTLVPWQLADTQ